MLRKIFIVYPYLTENIIDILKEFDKQIQIQNKKIKIFAFLPSNPVRGVYKNPESIPDFKNIQIKRIAFFPIKKNLNPFINPLGLFLNFIKFKPQDIIAFDEAISANVFLCSLLSFIFKIKVYFYAFENINKIKKYGLFKKIIFYFIKKNVNYGFVCTEEAKKVLNYNNWYPKVKNIWWGINTEIFKEDIPIQEKNKIKKSLGINNKTKVIGYVGRFVFEKGIKDLVSAFRLINLDAVLLFIGDGDLRDYLINLKQELPNKVFILPTQSQKDLAKFYKIMDILVLPSKTTDRWKEQYGRVIIEAMSSGVLVIGSNSGAIPEIINNSGFVFEEGDVLELKNILEYVLKNIYNQKIIQMKNFARERAQNGSIKNFVKNILNFIDEVNKL